LSDNDAYLTAILNSFLRLDLYVHSHVQDIRFDWSDPDTGRSKGFTWSKANRFMTSETFVGKETTEWPVSYISAPLIRIYGRTHAESGGEQFILRRNANSYDEMVWCHPMTVRTEPWSVEKASGTDASEEKVARDMVSEEAPEEAPDKESEVDEDK
jgi:hypothetical protein